MRIVDTRIKYVADIFGRIGFRGYTEQDVTYEGNGAITLSPSNFHDMKMDYGHLTYLSWDKYYESPEIQIENGDILFVKTGSTYGKSCFVSDLPMEATINPQLIVFKNFKMNAKLFAYVLQTNEIKNQCELAVVGGTIPTMSQKKIGNFQLQIPFYPEDQNAVVKFLDAKCAEIDALTADIQSQIDTLEQYKRSVITEAVTKGLNRDVEMKDSGIDGAGVTPSHWKSTRLCYECYIRARLGWRGLKADEYVDEGYAFISAFNIQNGKLVWTPLNYITKERFDESPEIKLHSGDVLIVKDGAGVGKCARVDDLPMGGTAPNSSIAVITPSKNLDYRYVCYYLQSAVFNNFVLLLYNGMGVPHLTQEVMSKIKILVPPLKEQMVISDYLDAKCTEIDDIVETKKSQLATLDEYKESLIYEYVTGKKEVPSV